MLRLEIRTGNGIFHETNEERIDYGGRLELARLLRDVANEIEEGYSEGVIVELYGNRCGSYIIEED